MSDRPLSIEVRDVAKSFRIQTDHPADRPRKDKLLHPFRAEHREFKVLEDISFEVERGEFFGVIGRNGSGKSTLLKILASVYAADAGRVRIAGRMAPFLELGVGFNQQQPARENVIMNAVMMGLTPDEAASRADEMIDFAGLSDHTDLQLKNYSSGMKVRLAFSVLTQVDADILLLDEVLAVGDSAFQQKCESVFTKLRDEGKTIVLVTHSMPTVNAFCDHALLLHDGRIDAFGKPIDVSNRYLEVNMRAAAEAEGGRDGYAARFAETIADPPIHIADAWLGADPEQRNSALGSGEPIIFNAELEVVRAVERPGFQFKIEDGQGQSLFMGGAADLELEGGHAEPGERLRVRVEVENRLAPGRYVISGGGAQLTSDGTSEPATPVTALNFEVEGTRAEGLMELDHAVTMERIDSDKPVIGRP
ncbi:MAG TPA: ABC transporter ATP-binding protein [Solirubrobacterales bacterium]|nr:ABC transporter ATP-binding protein [Solirubrobacterales bacterium]